MKKYLVNLVAWLYINGFKIDASKFNYTIFSDGIINQTWFDLFVIKSWILYDPDAVFRGITFAEFPNFRVHAEGLTIRARKRLNIIKICIHKS